METMTLKFINVGYGEAILLQCPDSRYANGIFTMLIDGGSTDPTEYADRSSGRIPFAEYVAQISLDHIDLMVSTHTHEDHICGLLPAAQKLCPTQFWQSLPDTFYRDTHELDVSLAQNLSQDKFLHALNDYRTLCGIVEQNGGKICTVGAGDSALAGFLIGYTRGSSIEECVRLATACGSATAAKDGTALGDTEHINALLPEIKAQKL